MDTCLDLPAGSSRPAPAVPRDLLQGIKMGKNIQRVEQAAFRQSRSHDDLLATFSLRRAALLESEV